tara:strand:- start:202 stop:327 length:126 start_codon:yes stop_codon:yes gene_type:complete
MAFFWLYQVKNLGQARVYLKRTRKAIASRQKLESSKQLLNP